MAWFAALIGAVGVLRIPDRYEASARVYVDTESVLKPLLAGLAVQPNVNQQLALLSRTLISRPNMEKLIRMNDIDLTVKSPQEKDDLIDRLTKNISIASGGNNLFMISTLDPQPENAKRVVQSLLTIFVESGLGGNRKDNDNAKRFIEEQIKGYERRLEEAENRLKEFRLKNMELTGPDGRDYLGRMNVLSDEAVQARLELRAAEQSRDALKREVAGEEPVFLLEDEGSPTQPQTTLAIDGRLNSLKKDLDELLRKYTEAHPDVVGTRRLIEQLEQQRRADLEVRSKAAPTRTRASAPSNNPVYQQLKISLAEAEANVASLRAKASDLETRLTQLRAAARLQPQIAAEFARLNRDYEVQRRQYESLVTRRETATISGEMDATTGVADFRIIDPPRVSDHPVTPNRVALIPLVLLAALGVGVAASFVVSQVFPTFHDPRTLREFAGLPVLGAVSRIKSNVVIQEERRNAWVFFAGLTGLVLFYIGWVAWISLGTRIIEGRL